jgi:hypothetical protein
MEPHQPTAGKLASRIRRRASRARDDIVSLIADVVPGVAVPGMWRRLSSAVIGDRARLLRGVVGAQEASPVADGSPKVSSKVVRRRQAVVCVAQSGIIRM